MENTAIYSTLDLRRHAVEAVQQGFSQTEVAKVYGVDRTTLYRWLKRFDQDGIDGLYRNPGSGRPKKRPDLTGEYLKKIVLESPLAFGFESDLWNIPRLHQIIMKDKGDDISREAIRRRLRESGLTYHKPEREYYEADETIRKKWRCYTIPKIRRCVLKNKAILYFQDEANISMTAFLGKTWAPRGTTPKATVSGLRKSITALSAISWHGALVFRLQEKRVASAEYIDFLRQMLQHHPRRHLVVVTDHATPHVSKVTRTFIEEQRRLHVFYLPPYSPKWNPDEKVWNYLKTQELKSHQARSKEELKELVDKKLNVMAHDPHLLKALYFRCCVADFLC